MVYAVSGAVITGSDGKQFTYKGKCSQCGTLARNESRAQISKWVNYGSYFCWKCRSSTPLKFSFPEVDTPQNSGGSAVGSHSVSSGDELAGALIGSLFSLVWWVFKKIWRLVRTFTKLVVFAVIIIAAALVFNQYLHFVSSGDLVRLLEMLRQHANRYM